MPEKPEVVTVARVLERRIVGKKIQKCQVHWDRIIAYPRVEEFTNKLLGQEIKAIKTRGKWIVIDLSEGQLLIHLRMEGKFFFRSSGEELSKHEHVVFTLDDGAEMRYHDVRKFGKMYYLSPSEKDKMGPLLALGYEYDDPRLNSDYLLERYAKKSLPIKSVLLDQSIVTGIGNIYDDEILFQSRINPYQKANTLNEKDCGRIIQNTKDVLDRAIAKGGTTIKSYTSEEGVHGLFQHELQVHGRKGTCPRCHTKIEKTVIGGRGTYFCPNCQPIKEENFVK